MEYDDFRRGMYCYWAQMKTFNKLLKMYMFVTLFTACVVALHNVMCPQFPAYVTSLMVSNQKCVFNSGAKGLNYF